MRRCPTRLSVLASATRHGRANTQNAPRWRNHEVYAFATVVENDARHWNASKAPRRGDFVLPMVEESVVKCQTAANRLSLVASASPMVVANDAKCQIAPNLQSLVVFVSLTAGDDAVKPQIARKALWGDVSVLPTAGELDAAFQDVSKVPLLAVFAFATAGDAFILG
ncbi:hypothetical protein AC1031_004347 [Aphanomyces cochlioides]|nr:hypothetical protein AC1031_004347 [Aphanomyces cochlioides]